MIWVVYWCREREDNELDALKWVAMKFSVFVVLRGGTVGARGGEEMGGGLALVLPKRAYAVFLLLTS
jgi:hypothetical protein